MTPGERAYNAYRKALGTELIKPHTCAREPDPYGVDWSALPPWHRGVWERVAVAVLRDGPRDYASPRARSRAIGEIK